MANSSTAVEYNLAVPGTSRLDGINWPWMVTRETLDAMKALEIWEDDVWVVTYPKSGTNWALEIVNLIFVEGYEQLINRAQGSAPPVEFDYSIQGMTVSSRRPPRPVPEFKDVPTWKAPRIINSHLPEEKIPEQIYQGKGKVVFVIRNPKDVAVSFWHFAVPWKFDKRYEDWECFFQMFLEGETIYGSWFDYTLNFWKKHRYDKNFLFLKFEDMKQDIKGVVIQIADFLGKPLSEESINRVIECSSLESMKRRFNTSASNPQLVKESPSPGPEINVDRTPPGTMTTKEILAKYSLGAAGIIRKGIIGDWKSKLTVAQNEAFDALYREKMVGSGLKIQFE